LQEQQRKAHGQREPHGPAHQAAGIGRHFTRLEFFDHHRDVEVQHHHAQRREEKGEAQNVYPHLHLLGQAAVEHVDAHMFALQQRVARGHQKRPGEQVPLHLEPGVGAVVERLAHHRVARADEGGGKNQPDGVFADLGVEPVDRFG